MAFVRFMSGPVGRAIRIIAGLALIIAGFFIIGGVSGTIIGIIGLLPLIAGGANLCFLGPLLGGHLSGQQNLRDRR